MRFIYNLLLSLGVLLAAPWLALRMFKGRYKNIARARLGLGREWLPSARVKGAIWVHALSVGEVGSAIPLLKALGRRFPDRPLVLSSSTAQGLLVARNILKDQPEIEVFTRPLDLPWAVGRLLDRLEPSLFCLVEGDIWPNWNWELKRRGIPRMLVNNRVSPRTFRGYQRLGGLARHLFLGFDRVLAQTRTDYERLSAIGLSPPRLILGGNLKFDAAPAELGQAEKEALAADLGLTGRKVILAGSTHESEEEPCLEAFRALQADHDGLCLVIAPREVHRGAEVARLAGRYGLSAARVSQGGDAVGVQVLVLDVLGVLARAYALAWAAFVGGSFVKVGGHNLLEPAAQGVPVLFGPITHNFLHMAKELEKTGGGLRVPEWEGLKEAWAGLLSDPQRSRAMGRAAQEFCRAHRGAVERAVNQAADLMEARYAA